MCRYCESCENYCLGDCITDGEEKVVCKDCGTDDCSKYAVFVPNHSYKEQQDKIANGYWLCRNCDPSKI